MVTTVNWRLRILSNHSRLHEQIKHPHYFVHLMRRHLNRTVELEISGTNKRSNNVRWRYSWSDSPRLQRTYPGSLRCIPCDRKHRPARVRCQQQNTTKCDLQGIFWLYGSWNLRPECLCFSDQSYRQALHNDRHRIYEGRISSSLRVPAFACVELGLQRGYELKDRVD